MNTDKDKSPGAGKAQQKQSDNAAKALALKAKAATRPQATRAEQNAFMRADKKGVSKPWMKKG